jgi:hypothetical protein
VWGNGEWGREDQGADRRRGLEEATENRKGDRREVTHLHPFMAPYTAPPCLSLPPGIRQVPLRGRTGPLHRGGRPHRPGHGHRYGGRVGGRGEGR